ncbi:MAG: DnaB-like helicase C-terminal domain-containing protein [Planctomycetota bacterium]
MIGFDTAVDGLLSAVLDNPGSLASVQTIIDPSDIGDRTGGDRDAAAVFRLLANLHDSGKAIGDPLLVVDALDGAGLLDRFGGPDGFARRFTHSVASENAAVYARAVRDHATSRRVASLARGIDARAEQGQDGPSTLAWLRSQIESIESRQTDADCVTSLEAACAALCDDLAANAANDIRSGVACGVSHLEALYGGLHPSRLYVLAARPGAGKSSLAQQMVESAAADGTPSMLVSLEMPTKELAGRYIARSSGLNSKIVSGGRLNQEQAEKVFRASESAGDTPLFIAEPLGRAATAEGIAALCRVEHQRRGLGLVAVDYLQIINASHRSQGEYDRITSATRIFKQLAMQIGAPVLLLSQLNRSTEKENRPPRLSDLRSSGSIEQDADAVMFLHDETGPSARGNTRKLRLIIAKMRGGERSACHLAFDGPTTTFSDWTDGSTEGGF